MKKKIIAVVLALCMATALLPAAAFAAGEGEPPCTVTTGCTLAEGHAGACVLPAEGGEPAAPAACTKTEGCTLAGGHAGACVLPAEGGEPAAPAAPADDGVNTPEELEAALAAGGEVVLTGDIAIDAASKSFTIQNVVTLDLNGFSITRTGDSGNKLFTIKNNGSLTLNDSKGTGAVNSTYPVQLYSNATFIMNGGAITSSRGAALDISTSAVNVKVEINGGSVTVAPGRSDNVFGIRGRENVKVDINGGNILAAGSNRLAMYVSGDKDGAIELNISGGSVQHTGQAIQAYSGAVINVSGNAVIRSETGTAISTQSGYGVVELNVTGGTVSSGRGYGVQAQEESRVSISGGTVSGGTAVSVYDSASVAVTGGALEGKTAAIGKSSSATPTISVTGGRFSHDVADYVPAGNTMEKDENGDYVMVVDKTTAVAEAGGVGYTEVQAAINAVAAGGAAGTVTLLQNAAESITVPAGADVTLELGAFTLTNSGKADTISNRGTLTVQGAGKVDNITHGYGALVNYPGGKAVLAGGTFDRSAETSGNSWYTVKNLGEMEIRAGATVKTGEGSKGSSSLIANGWYNGSDPKGTSDRNTPHQEGQLAKLTITGGAFSGGMNTVKNDDYGVLNISGGTFNNTTGPIVLNWNETTISGGDFTATNGAVLANGYLAGGADKGKLTITGGTFTSGNNGADALFAYGVGSDEGGALTVTGGAFAGVVGGAAHYEVRVSGGRFTSEVPADYCADGFAPSRDPATGDYTVHTHALVKTEAVAPTCAAEGTEAYWTCSVCGKLFGDAAGTAELDAPVKLPKGPHAWQAAWASDGSSHWHACGVCGEKADRGAHTFGEWRTTLAPTATETGVQEKNCTVCGFGVCATVPATGTATPQTGDTFPVWLFVVLLCAGTAGLAAVAVIRLRGGKKRGRH